MLEFMRTLKGPLAKHMHSSIDTRTSPVKSNDATVLTGTPALFNSDIEAIDVWLQSRASRSPSTYDRYARVACRFLQFLSQISRGLKSVTLTDIQAYENALGQGRVTRKPLSPGAVDAEFVVLTSLYSFLNRVGYVQYNVLALRKRSGVVSDTRQDRFLCEAEVKALLSEASSLARGDNAYWTPDRAERIRFILIWFLTMGPRVTEVLQSPMNAVYLAPSGGRQQWFWRVRRKGQREMDLPVRDDAIDGLAHYRRHLGLPPYPAPHRDEGYLIWPLKGQSVKPLSRGVVSGDLKVFFLHASKRIESPAMASHLCMATTHWLRHTAATQLLDAGAGMRFVSRLLGHANIQVTSSIYDHADRSRWRDELSKGPPVRIAQ